MDLGALCCTRNQPKCTICPLQTHCHALQANDVDSYPQKKPKKTRPIRKEQFLLLHTTDNQISLEQRPLEGIWGGLWCLPSLSQDVDITTYMNNTYALQPDIIQPLMTYKHSFTHFHLHINAYSIQTHAHLNFAGAWFYPCKLKQLGLAKPVKDIIDFFWNK